VAVAVFAADVLIAYLGREDASHGEAVERMRKALEPGTRRMISAVNYTEVLIGPLRHAGAPGAEHSRRDARSLRHGDNPGRPGPRPTRCRGAGSNASQAAGCVRIATAIHAEKRGHGDVRLETFDEKVLKAYKALHPITPELG
jgi:hypothetical protein